MLWEGENALLLENLLAALYRAMRTDSQRLIACIYRDAEHPKVPLKAIPQASPRPPVLHLKFSAPSLLADCHVE